MARPPCRGARPQGNVYEPPPAPSNPFAAAAPTAGPPAVPPAAPPFDDHDGHTVAGGWDPNQFARQQPGIPGPAAGPERHRPRRSPGWCSPAARPSTSTGPCWSAGPPRRAASPPTDQPRLVTVPSPHQEISSTHLEVRPGSGADHGSAVVTDLGSTNGTVLAQPGLDAGGPPARHRRPADPRRRHRPRRRRDHPGHQPLSARHLMTSVHPRPTPGRRRSTGASTRSPSTGPSPGRSVGVVAVGACRLFLRDGHVLARRRR